MTTDEALAQAVREFDQAVEGQALDYEDKMRANGVTDYQLSLAMAVFHAEAIVARVEFITRAQATILKTADEHGTLH